MKAEHSPFTFSGGIHPSYCKELSAGAAIRKIAIPQHLVVPLSQHLGAPAKPIVKPGDIVKRNQLIGEATGFISAPVHAPVGGKVTALTETTTATGKIAPAIIIEPSEQEEVECLPRLGDWHKIAPATLIARIGEAGVVGMGGAGFPTRVKLSPPPEKRIDTVIINGAECEPYLTADHRMMLEHAKEIRIGAEIIRHVLGAQTLRIAIEDNKPDAIEAMKQALQGIEGDVEVAILHTSYPQGAEKQQIYSVTGRQVPRGGLPMDVGCVVENVSTAFAIYDAVINGQPLTHRVISVSGDAITMPSNLWVPSGTSHHALVKECGGLKSPVAKVISGGPMMGFAVTTLEIPTTKTSSGLLLLSAASVTAYTSQACISCGRCVDSCPMRLSPCEMSQCIEANDIDGAASISLMDCIECGSCAYVCPAHRPLVHHFRRGKGVVAARRAATAGKK